LTKQLHVELRERIAPSDWIQGVFGITRVEADHTTDYGGIYTGEMSPNDPRLKIVTDRLVYEPAGDRSRIIIGAYIHATRRDGKHNPLLHARAAHVLIVSALCGGVHELELAVPHGCVRRVSSFGIEVLGGETAKIVLQNDRHLLASFSWIDSVYTEMSRLFETNRDLLPKP
jgi:hypothetical protein